MTAPRFSPVSLTACALPLAVLALAWVWGPPLLFSDTATGLLAWRNFADGGAWNTIAEPSAADIAATVETPVTWWSPGQYIPLGLLTSARLPLGVAMLLLALLSAAGLALGLARLARALGAPTASLPWVALAAAGSWHTLYAFGMFNGGETLLIALWPWIALAALTLRERPWAQLGLLPPLLLLGGLAKHSFVIWGLALLAFLGVEEWRRRGLFPLATALRLGVVLAVFLVARRLDFFGAGGVSPGDPGQVERGAAEVIGFAATGPWLSAFGGSSFFGRLFAVAGLGFEDGWKRLAWPLLLLAPLPLALFVWLATRPRPLERFAGVIALVVTLLLGWLFWRGASVSFEDRHFRPAGVALLAVVAAATASPRPALARAAKITVAGVVAFGVLAALQRHHNLHRLAHRTDLHASLTDLPPTALAELRTQAGEVARQNGLLFLPTPEPSAFIPRCRLISTDAAGRDVAWIAARPRRGRVSRLVLALPERMAADGRAAALRASFVDYDAEEWTRRSLAGWDFWIAAAPSAAPAPTP